MYYYHCWQENDFKLDKDDVLNKILNVQENVTKQLLAAINE